MFVVSDVKIQRADNQNQKAYMKQPILYITLVCQFISI